MAFLSWRLNLEWGCMRTTTWYIHYIFAYAELFSLNLQLPDFSLPVQVS